jgi:hypothetical protein
MDALSELRVAPLWMTELELQSCWRELLFLPKEDFACSFLSDVLLIDERKSAACLRMSLFLIYGGIVAIAAMNALNLRLGKLLAWSWTNQKNRAMVVKKLK